MIINHNLKNTHKSDMIHFPPLMNQWYVCLVHSASQFHTPLRKDKSRTVGTCIFILLRAFFFFFASPTPPTLRDQLRCKQSVTDPPPRPSSPARSSWQDHLILHALISESDVGAEVPSSALAFLGIPRPDLTSCHASSALSKVLIFSPTRSFSLHNKNTRRLHS